MPSPEEFRAWLRKRSGPRVYVYHTGSLMRDRQKDPAIDKIARQTWAAYMRGWVDLLQRRARIVVDGEEHFTWEYLAVRRRG